MNHEALECITEIAIQLHPDKVCQMAKEILLRGNSTDVSQLAVSLGAIPPVALKQLQGLWEAHPELSPLEISVALRASSQTAALLSERESVDMVWTGPSSNLVASRHTEQVLLEVIRSASHRLFVVSFVAYDCRLVAEELNRATDQGIQVDMLFESSRQHGGRIDIDSVKMFQDLVPEANVHIWDESSKKESRLRGSVHAKCAVADGYSAFITSANLTRSAMESNMELGVVLKGGDVPKRLHDHLEGLITTGVLTKWAGTI